MSGNFVYRHHVEPRVKLYVSRAASFIIPLKYIDVTRATSTSLDVMLDDGDRELSHTWRGFTRFTKLAEKPPDGYTWSGERLTRKQTTSRPDSLWPEIWKICRERRSEEKKVGTEKPKLDNASKLRGIYFTDPADEELKEIMKNARRKLEVPMPAAQCLAEADAKSTGRPVAFRKM